MQIRNGNGKWMLAGLAGISMLVGCLNSGEGAGSQETSALSIAGDQSGGAKKVDVCHIPPGNPANAHTITVGEPAVQAHLAHGDSLGVCKTVIDSVILN